MKKRKIFNKKPKKVIDEGVKGIVKAKEYLIDDTAKDLNTISKKLDPNNDGPCQFYYAKNKECMRISKLLVMNDIIGFNVIMDGKINRNCMGLLDACYFADIVKRRKNNGSS